MADAIIGREPELAALGRFLDSVASGSGAALVAGPPGAGKTTLWLATCEEARRRGHRVLVARPTESETTFSFAALSDLVGDVLDEVWNDLPLPQRTALSVALLREPPGASALDQRAVATGTLTALRILSRASPVMVAVDDVQWLDSASESVLGFVVRRLGTEPVALLLAHRAADADMPPLRLDRPSPHHPLLSMPLGPLSLGGIRVLIEGRLAATFPRPILRRIHDASGGNPLVALELGRDLRRSGRVPTTTDPLPISGRVHGLFTARLSALPPMTRAELLVVAALARPTPAAVDMEVLGPAFAAGVLATEAGRLRFEHPLLAAAVYSQATETERHDVHARLAVTAADIEESARHLALSTDRPDERVAERLEAASRTALARGAVVAAAELMERSRALTPEHRDGDVLRRTVDAASHQFEAGDPDRARELLEKAAAATDTTRRADVLTRLARVNMFEANHQTAALLYREVLDGEPADARVCAEANAGIAVVLMRMLEDLPAAACHARRAVEEAGTTGDMTLVAEALAIESMLLALRGKTEAREQAAAAVHLNPAATEIEERSGFGFLRAQGPSFMQGVVLAWTDDLPGARARLVAARQRALHLGDEGSVPLILRHLASVEILDGNWAEAAQLVDDGLEGADQAGQLAQRAVLLATGAVLDALRGRAAEATEKAEASALLSERTGAKFGWAMSRSALGTLALSRGDAHSADLHLGPVVDHLERAGVREPGALRIDADAVEALLLLGEVRAATELLDRLEERASELHRISVLANAARCRGLLTAVGNPAGALPHFEAALALHDRVTVPVDRGRTLLALGSTQRRLRQWRSARASLDAATATFERLGARQWAVRAHEESSRIGGRAPSAGGLTPTELRIAELVCDGRSNRDVAAALFVTVKTVESNLTRIYAKLGVSSRTALVRRLADAPAGAETGHGLTAGKP